MKKILTRLLGSINNHLGNNPSNRWVQLLQAREYRELCDIVAKRTPENIALQGFKVYSQHDEDGIIHEIFRRIGGCDTFIEIGVQDGVECNSLNLLLNGSRGIWIEGDDTQISKMSTALGGLEFKNRFKVLNVFVDAGNILQTCESCLNFLKAEAIDFFSLDIDGNDIYILDEILKNKFRPKVFCVEYNAKFPPYMDISIRYNPSHMWDKTDYQGASLQAFVNLFSKYDYTLVTCNLVGVNAFFVRNDLVHNFKIYSPTELYQPARYYLSPMVHGHTPSLKFLKDALHGT